MRLHIEYTNSESRSLICDIVDQVEKDMDVHPEVLHRRSEKDGGTFSIEFSGETYVCTRTSGDFIENVLEKLKIKECEYL